MIPRPVSCGCCTGGCVCAHHQDIPAGRPRAVCEYHAKHGHPMVTGLPGAVVERPEFLTDEMLEFLDAVRDEADGSAERVVRPRLEARFGLDACRAGIAVTWWCKTFAERHGVESRALWWTLGAR